jgi:hypothetical protein
MSVFSAGDVLHVRGVGEDQRAAFRREHLPDRAPVDAGRLHDDAGAAVPVQPVREGEEPRRGGREGLDLPPDRPVALDHAHRGDHGILVHVQSRTAGIENLHRDLLGDHAADAGSREIKV